MYCQGLVKTLPKVKGVVTAGIVYWGDAPQETVQVCACTRGVGQTGMESERKRSGKEGAWGQ